MTVRVLLFASYADAVGSNELALELHDGSTVGDVIARVRELAGAHTLPPSPLLAVNAAFATTRDELKAGDEVAIIPPVAGG
jgi:molybdopterin converting factor subunit 1